MKISSRIRGILLATSVAAVGIGTGHLAFAKARPAAPPPVPAAGSAQLRLRYTAGQRLNYTTTSSQTQQLPGAPTPMQISTTANVSIETTRVLPDGSAEQRMRMANMNMSGPGIPPSVAQEINRGLAGMTLSYTQNPRGQITARQPAAGVSAALRPLVDGILQSIDQMAPAFPENAIAVGATWAEHKNMHMNLGPASIDLAIDVTYTLRQFRPAANGGTAVLDMTMRMTFPRPVTMQGASLTGTGTATGNLSVDLGRGGITSSTSNGSMNMQVSARGQNVSITSSFQNTMSLVP